MYELNGMKCLFHSKACSLPMRSWLSSAVCPKLPCRLLRQSSTSTTRPTSPSCVRHDEASASTYRWTTGTSWGTGFPRSDGTCRTPRNWRSPRTSGTTGTTRTSCTPCSTCSCVLCGATPREVNLFWNQV